MFSLKKNLKKKHCIEIIKYSGAFVADCNYFKVYKAFCLQEREVNFLAIRTLNCTDTFQRLPNACFYKIFKKMLHYTPTEDLQLIAIDIPPLISLLFTKSVKSIVEASTAAKNKFINPYTNSYRLIKLAQKIFLF